MTWSGPNRGRSWCDEELWKTKRRRRTRSVELKSSRSGLVRAGASAYVYVGVGKLINISTSRFNVFKLHSIICPNKSNYQLRPIKAPHTHTCSSPSSSSAKDQSRIYFLFILIILGTPSPLTHLVITPTHGRPRRVCAIIFHELGGLILSHFQSLAHHRNYSSTVSPTWLARSCLNSSSSAHSVLETVTHPSCDGCWARVVVAVYWICSQILCKPFCRRLMSYNSI